MSIHEGLSFSFLKINSHFINSDFIERRKKREREGKREGDGHEREVMIGCL